MTDEWTKSRKGNAIIWRHPAVKWSVIDRRYKDFGPRRVTWQERPFQSVDEAKAFAIRKTVEDMA